MPLLEEGVGVYEESLEGTKTLYEKTVKMWSPCWSGSHAALGPFPCVSGGQLNYQAEELSP